MKSIKIKEVKLRGILNSCGRISSEAQIYLKKGISCKGSSPSALKPGRREQKVYELGTLGEHPFTKDINRILNTKIFHSPIIFDRFLSLHIKEMGSGVILALSIAFWKLFSKLNKIDMVKLISIYSGTKPALPQIMVNLFSGGIHGFRNHNPFQQIMLLPNFGCIEKDIQCSIDIYNKIERDLLANEELFGYSASSGLLSSSYSYIDLFEKIIKYLIKNEISTENIRLGIDIAAEHLRQSNGSYSFGEEILNKNELFDRLKLLIEKYDIKYIEDPFSLEDEFLWMKLMKEIKGKRYIVGDDLFATNSKFVNKEAANCILLKMNQIGTISATIESAKHSLNQGLNLCVSHRSCETQETIMCDLAVALGAKFIKIGGPRGGERVIKYNSLLSHAENHIYIS